MLIKRSKIFTDQLRRRLNTLTKRDNSQECEGRLLIAYITIKSHRQESCHTNHEQKHVL